MDKTIKIKEYDALVAGSENGKKLNGKYTTLTKENFEKLEEFVLNLHSNSADAIEVMSISAKRGVGKAIIAKNYVGIISFNNITIEILPKIYSSSSDDEEKKVKNLLVRMLRTHYKIKNINLQSSNLDTANMPLLELFIRMFVDEVSTITRRGIRSNYETLEENANFFKGKLIFSQHIRKNFAHKERNFVAFDAFTVNRPENRILKTALQYLYKRSSNSRTKRDIRYQLSIFDEVETCTDIDADFAKITADRNTKDYSTALTWANIFLKGKSFSTFTGQEIALALLFPMDKLFESYIASIMKNDPALANFNITSQIRSKHLFDTPERFLLKPDIAAKNTATRQLYLYDTKWKIITEDKHISQADMYQMYAYHKKYNPECVTLLYPKSDNTSAVTKRFASLDNVIVNVRFIDMFSAEDEIHKIAEDIMLSSANP